MKNSTVAIAIASVFFSIAAMAQRLSTSQSGPTFPATPVALGGANLPFQPLGASDLVRLTVYDAPELTQSFRIDSQGNLNLPLVQSTIHAAGLFPDQLRDAIAATLRAQHLLVHPVVDVSVVEYRSRDVTIAGAVKTPTTIQEFGNLRVLEALSQAGGLLPEAGPEIIVEQADGSLARLSVRELFDGRHPELNIRVKAGAQIRVPPCDRVFVVGNVKRPGAFPFRSLEDTTVLQLLALSGGLDSFSQNIAYIYRVQPGSTQKTEIEIPLRRILDRKADDVKLAANDILYVPTNRKLKNSATVVNHVTGIGNTAVSAAIWAH
ncbi:MAG TPA: polysaccharide biosynthesis/export family protein [Acidobacteriaceae bacterium]|nr:polysaccharide biosynthesis/export family protein [Acidobacteriaceae bacterium]